MRYLVYYDSCDSPDQGQRAYWTHAQPPMGSITNSAPYHVLTELQARRVISDHTEVLRDITQNFHNYVSYVAVRGERFIYITNFFAEKIRAAVHAADQTAYEKRRRERQRRRYCRIFRQ